MQKPTRKIPIAISGLALLLVVIAAMQVLPFKNRAPWNPPPSSSDKVTLLTLGDFGEANFRQRRVAAMLEEACRSAVGEKLVQTVGDNFYSAGVSDIDDPQWTSKFESVYDTPCLMQTRFFAALGNHDYVGSIAAQSEYQNHGTGRWQMPANFYIHDHGMVDGRALVRIVVVDTMTDLKEQIAMIETAFADPDAAIWRVVVGHYNIRTYSEKYHDDDDLQYSLMPALMANQVNFYISGHSHNLQLIENSPVRPDTGREPVYLVSGGGGASPRELLEADPEVAPLLDQKLGFPVVTF
ncbi:MAG: metallophosphoesterase, partial [Planctomycetaceae bacterium]|nr:metallophosphoesterase [Planctomycetaceae bacterium]